ncbi:DNA-packaging protein [Rhizobium binxianense]
MDRIRNVHDLAAEAAQAIIGGKDCRRDAQAPGPANGGVAESPPAAGEPETEAEEKPAHREGVSEADTARDKPPAQQGHETPELSENPIPAGPLTPEERADRFNLYCSLSAEWGMLAHDEQNPPKGDWRTWLLLGGRGSGKTRAGAEWVHAIASEGRTSDLRIALVAETLGDAREVMIDGVSGICRVARTKRPEFEASRRRLVWPNGAVAQIFSSEDPESLRGPQFHLAWCDELAKWKHAQESWDMLQFALRLGPMPRQLVTTTPRPVPLLKALIADSGTRLVRISSRANAENLAPGYIEALAARYGGTRLGRQELDGELIEDREDALWKREAIEALTIRFPGAMRRIVVAVDPPAAAGPKSCCGIVVAGLEASGRAVVLADCSVEGASPAGWAGAVAKAYRRFDADRIVAEVNQGGDMVAALLKSIDAGLPVSTVRATRGKFLRAEPVAALYEQGRVAHAGRFPELEDQMCDFGPDGLSSGRSPDRLDALVWALTALMLEGGGEPRVREV